MSETHDEPDGTVTLVVSSLQGGGTERVVVDLARWWSQRGRSVHVVTLADPSRDRYELPASVRRTGLGLLSRSDGPLDGLLATLERVRALRTTLRDIGGDVTISFIHRTNVLVLLAARPLDQPVVVSERNHPGFYELPLSWRLLQRWTYPWAETVVVQTEDIREWVKQNVPGARTRIIPNAVDIPSEIDSSCKDRSRIVAAGSLTHQKGFDMLLEAFARAAADRPDWMLRIHGEGPKREALERRARDLGIQDRVEFPGWTEDIYKALASGSVFCLSSRYEGFPNVLLESMAVGTPPVCFDCPTGPGEIVRSEENGVLVPSEDVNALADALGRLMDDPDEREAMGKRARRVRDRFTPDDIMERWDALVREVTT